MENYSYSSYPDSGDSSPRSREIDCENQSWDEPVTTNYKVKFMCSYGGKIQPRHHDNQLAYVGGDTKILAVDRNIKFNAIMNKLSAIYGDENVCFKYQLPGEDLDALISVTNDEDLDHMMLEYDRLYRASTKPARLRLFLFPLNSKITAGFEEKSERQWFVDALNSVQIQTLEGSSPTAAAGNPDFLFGLDKPKLPETVVMAAAPVITEVVVKDVTAGSDCGSEDHLVDMQRLNINGISSHEQQAILTPRASYGGQKLVTEKMAPPLPPGPLPMQMQMPIPASYLPTAGNYQTEQPVYFIQSGPPATGVYSTPGFRQVTGPGLAGQGYYGMQRMVQEQPMYNMVSVAPASIQQQTKIGGYSEGIGVVQQQQQQPKGGMMAEGGFVQVAYDGAGRQVYYTAAAAAPVVSSSGGMPPLPTQYHALNQEGKVLVNAMAPPPPQTSSV